MPGLPPLDAHCHPTHPGVVAAVEGAYLFAQSVTPAEWDAYAQQPAVTEVVWGLGLHPLWLKADEEVDGFLERLDASVAVGEIGLDYTPQSPLGPAEQRKVLSRILEHPAVAERVVSFHALLAYSDVVAMIKEFGVRGAIIHWYADPESYQQAIENDIFFSVNDAIFAVPEQAAVVAELPVNRVLTETDSPYIQRGTGAVVYGNWLPFVDPDKDYSAEDATRLHPGEVTDSERSLSKIWKMDEEEVRFQIWQNLAELEARVSKRPFGAADLVAAKV